MSTDFEIKILNLWWLDTKLGKPDSGHDLCVHGELFIKIGDEVLTNGEEGWTISAAVFFLLRTLFVDYHHDFENELIPDCGHTMWPDGKRGVMVLGCPNGLNWTIEHQGNNVKHTTENGSVAVISEEDYIDMILRLADQVEDFYEKHPRILPEDKHNLEGYHRFWENWQMLKSKAEKRKKRCSIKKSLRAFGSIIMLKKR